MSRETSFCWILTLLLATALAEVTAGGGPPAVGVAGTDAELVAACRRAIRGCQLADGAIALVGYRLEGHAADIDPYFANLAAFGLLAAHAAAPGPDTAEAVEAWLRWFAAHQEADGTIKRFVGVRTSANLQKRVTVLEPDSHDSYAATYLLVAGRYCEVTGRRPDPKVVAACRKCIDVLKRCRADGMYWNFDPRATPAGKVRAQYLLDNIEVYQGLVGASRLFGAAGDAHAAGEADAMARGLSEKLGDFWVPEGRFFVGVHGDKAAKVPWGKQPLASEGLATVSAIAFFDGFPDAARAALWDKLFATHGAALRRGVQSASFGAEDPAVERVYLAARRGANRGEQAAWRDALRKRARQMLARTASIPDRGADPGDPAAVAAFRRAVEQEYPFAHRYGLVIVALLADGGPPQCQLPTVPIAWPPR